MMAGDVRVELAIWLAVPIVALLVFFMIGGDFTACGA
jgi:hypothetical protein